MTTNVTIPYINKGGTSIYKYYTTPSAGVATTMYNAGGYSYPFIELNTHGFKNKQITIKILNVTASNQGYVFFWGSNDAAGTNKGVNCSYPTVTGGTYDATTHTRTYTVTCNYNYLWVTATTGSLYYDSCTYSLEITGISDTPQWGTANDNRFGGGTKSTLSVSNSGNVRIYKSYSSSSMTTSYSYQSTNTPMYYLPSDTTEREIQIFSTRSDLAFFTANSTSSSDLSSIQQISFPTKMDFGSKTLYTVTVPANKILYITYLVSSGSSGATYYYNYDGVNPDEIGYHLDAGWNTFVIHKFNGTSWD